MIIFLFPLFSILYFSAPRFNELNNRYRTVIEIKQQWRLSKLDAKKRLSNYKREQSETGGGQKPPSPDCVTNEILEMIPQEFEVDCNKFDSDGIMFQVIYYVFVSFICIQYFHLCFCENMVN